MDQFDQFLWSFGRSECNRAILYAYKKCLKIFLAAIIMTVSC